MLGCLCIALDYAPDDCAINGCAVITLVTANGAMQCQAVYGYRYKLGVHLGENAGMHPCVLAQRVRWLFVGCVCFGFFQLLEPKGDVGILNACAVKGNGIERVAGQVNIACYCPFVATGYKILLAKIGVAALGRSVFGTIFAFVVSAPQHHLRRGGDGVSGQTLPAEFIQVIIIPGTGVVIIGSQLLLIGVADIGVNRRVIRGCDGYDTVFTAANFLDGAAYQLVKISTAGKGEGYILNLISMVAHFQVQAAVTLHTGAADAHQQAAGGFVVRDAGDGCRLEGNAIHFPVPRALIDQAAEFGIGVEGCAFDVHVIKGGGIAVQLIAQQTAGVFLRKRNYLCVFVHDQAIDVQGVAFPQPPKQTAHHCFTVGVLDGVLNGAVHGAFFDGNGRSLTTGIAQVAAHDA